MESRVAVISIIAENRENISQINHILTVFGDYIIGRMGIPYKKRDLFLIAIAVDAPQDIISAVSGKIGAISGVSTKIAYSNQIFAQGENDETS